MGFSDGQVFVKDEATGANATGFPTAGIFPIWSLMGTELAFISGTQISAYNFRSATTRPVGSSANSVIPRVKDTYWDPVWSPNGSRIAFILSSDSSASRVDIYAMNSDGSNVVNLTGSLSTTIHALPAWSPDGTELAITASGSGALSDFEIYIINATSGALIATVTDDTVPDGKPFWSVDGTKLAYMSASCSTFCVVNGDGTLVEDNNGNPVFPATFSPAPSPAGRGEPLDWDPVWHPEDGTFAFSRFSPTPPVTSAIYLQNGSSSTLLYSTGWFAKWRPSPEETLPLYGIEVLTLSEWESSGYIPELAYGIETAVRAFSTFHAQYSTSEPPHQVFKRIFVDGATDPRIAFSLSSSSSNCLTTYRGGGYVATIVCSSAPTAPLTEFTVVHELGHVLVGRTGEQASTNGLFELIYRPDRIPGGYDHLRFDNTAIFGIHSWRSREPIAPSPAGTPTATPNYAIFDDWLRGNSGWASGADSYPQPKYEERIVPPIDPPAVVWVGPCGSPAAEVPTSFQQNPCYLKNWVVQNRTAYTSIPDQLASLNESAIAKLAGIEVEEMAGDMVLNWSYRTLNQGGFENLEWINRENSIPAPSTGDMRFDWMNCALVFIFNQYDFWQLGDVNIPISCDIYGL